MALFTDFPAALPYLRPLDFFFELERFLVAISSSLISEKRQSGIELRLKKCPLARKKPEEARSRAAQTSLDSTILLCGMLIFFQRDIDYKKSEARKGEETWRAAPPHRKEHRNPNPKAS
jgi:hypothetical protein